MMKLSPARKADNSPLGAVLLRILSQARQTRYDEELAAMAGRSQVSNEKIMLFPPIWLKCTIPSGRKCGGNCARAANCSWGIR